MKKFISLALCLLLVVGAFVMPTSALTTDAVCAIEIKPTEGTYAKGDVVTFEVFYESSSDLGLMGEAINFVIGYDSSVFETVEDITTAKALSDASTVVTAGYPVSNNIELSVSLCQSGRVGSAYLNANDKAKGWDNTLYVAMAGVADCDDDYSTKAASWAFQLKLKEDAADDGCYVVGVPEGAINGEKVEINEELGSIYGPSGTDFELSYEDMFATTDATVKVAAPAVVFHDKVQIQWNNKDENTINLGFKGKFNKSDIDIAFADTGKSTNIVEVGAEVTGNKTTKAGTKFVYTPDNETFYFRGVIEGLDLDVAEEANTAITVRYYVIDVDGNEYWSDPVTLKTAAEYATVLKK